MDAPRRNRGRPASRRGPPPALDVDCALFLDIDGTLLELAPTPDGVHVDAGVAALLPALARRLGGAVALITGRTMADADRLFQGLALPIAGQHGLERRGADGTVHRHLPSLTALERLRGVLAQFAARHDGLFLEDKGATLALHYRLAPALASHRASHAARSHDGRAGRRIGVAPAAGEGHSRNQARRTRQGHGDPRIHERSRRSRTRRPVFVGDDLTDEYGFAAVTTAGGWAVKVGDGRTSAHYRLPDVTAVRAWLAAFVRHRAGNGRGTDAA